ncbi:MAG: hypothetical protein M0D54_18115 [Hyphomonadaceae bacterium JAD_PAG50586_4]|nr:MAG: hypothetical protein M0D54_18115 [Hyphomonadaceae bacterium JAD_PAG50586_4]
MAFQMNPDANDLEALNSALTDRYRELSAAPGPEDEEDGADEDEDEDEDED